VLIEKGHDNVRISFCVVLLPFARIHHWPALNLISCSDELAQQAILFEEPPLYNRSTTAR
jgi:hypothetical protein